MQDINYNGMSEEEKKAEFARVYYHVNDGIKQIRKKEEELQQEKRKSKQFLFSISILTMIVLTLMYY